MATPFYHARSNSFPNRPHPLSVELDEQLRRLRSSQASCTSSISQQLNGIQDLYDSVDKLLLLPLSQQSLAQAQHKNWTDELLAGSIRVLDVCDTVKDTLLQTKECSHQLQSILRRRCGVETEVKKYLTSRKVVKQAIKKALAILRAVETCPSKNNNERSETVSMLKEVETITITVMESLLSFISSSTTAPTKLRGWSLVSKLVKPKRIACEEEENSKSEFQKVDAALYSLINQAASNKSYSVNNPENTQKRLKELDLCIQDLEGGLERLYRCLIKTRVSLLNILNH